MISEYDSLSHNRCNKKLKLLSYIRCEQTFDDVHCAIINTVIELAILDIRTDYDVL